VDTEAQRLGASSSTVDLDTLLRQIEPWAAWLRPHLCDVGSLVDDAINANRRVLFEGAQGALLDLDHGTYPFVTSSSTTAGGVCTGVGIGPTAIDRVWGITKAYATRVGSGPFPSKLEGDVGAKLRELGAEFGATTGRPRDCGWLDLPALRYAARLNGMTGLCVTKLDVLARMSEAQVCVAYRDGRQPGADDLSEVEPVFETIEGWGDPQHADRLREARSLDDLPRPVRAYLDRVVESVGVPVVLISTGAERKETIMLDRAFD
jgi:adenylosuccinate synthase